VLTDIRALADHFLMALPNINIPEGEVVTAGMFLVNQHPAVVLFDSGASH